MKIEIPDVVRDHIYMIFSEVNDRISRKITKIPNIPEESLDISFIETLSNYSAPRVVAPDWAVRIAAHFIGNIRHRRRYEIADIGIVFVFKKGPAVLARKLVLLQSKRLYPSNNEVIEFDDFDYDLGLALVTERERLETPLFSQVRFEFDITSAYGALKPNSNQCSVIQEHLRDTNIPVFYLMYNPLVLPWQISYPTFLRDAELPQREFGTRIISADKVHRILESRVNSVALKVADLSEDNENNYLFGFSLEDFFDDVVRCEQGYLFDRNRDAGLRRLFARKSGPIFCIVEVVIEKDASIAGSGVRHNM